MVVFPNAPYAIMKWVVRNLYHQYFPRLSCGSDLSRVSKVMTDPEIKYSSRVLQTGRKLVTGAAKALAQAFV